MIVLNEGQEYAVNNLDIPIFLIASAGTGKTQVLVERFIKILSRGDVRVNEILAITFTQKAAIEMELRILERIEKELNDSREKSYWLGVKRDFEQNQISTIHSFCSRLVKEYANDLWIKKDFNFIESSELKYHLSQFLKDLFIDRVEGDDELGRLMRELLRIYSYEELKWFLLNLLLNRYEVEGLWGWNGQKSARDYRLNFERFYERELKDRLSLILKSRVVKVFFNHVLLMDLTDKKEGFRKYARSCQEVIRGLQEGRIEEGIHELYDERKLKQRYKYYCSKEDYEDFCEGLRALKRYLPGVFLGKPESVEVMESFLISEKRLKLYGMILKEMRRGFGSDLIQEWERGEWLMYDDLQFLVYEKLLKEGGSNLRVRGDILGRYRHIMVDEVQDIDEVQKKILEVMMEGKKGVFLVGDMKQSIYHFRGSDIGLIKELMEGKEVLELGLNYRSDVVLIDFVNDIFGVLMGEGFEDFEVSDYQRMEGVRNEGVGLVELMFYEDIEEDARNIAKRIKGLVDDRGVNFGDIAILFQSLTEVQTYERVFLENGILCETVDARGRNEKQEIQDCIQILKVLDDPYDDLALCGVLRSPLCGVRDESLYWLTDGGVRSLRDGFVLVKKNKKNKKNEELNLEDREKLLGLYDLIEGLRRKKDLMKVHELLMEVMVRSGYMDFLRVMGVGGEVEDFILKVRELEGKRIWDLDEMIGYLEVTEDFLDFGYGGIGDRVKLMSIHKSKGMEFLVVVIPRLDQKRLRRGELVYYDRELGVLFRGDTLYRYALDKDQRRELAEMKRLFYVGVTRAKDHLVLTTKRKGRNIEGTFYDGLVQCFKSLKSFEGGYFDGEELRGLKSKIVVRG